MRINSTLASELFAQWQINGTGRLGLGPANELTWFRASENIFASLGEEDPSAGPTSAHYELIPVVSGREPDKRFHTHTPVQDGFLSKRVAFPTEGHYFSFVTAVISPSARKRLFPRP